MPGQLSHGSPTPSWSRSAWVGFATVGQLSQLSPMPSPSRSWAGSDGQTPHASPVPSPSSEMRTSLAYHAYSNGLLNCSSEPSRREPPNMRLKLPGAPK